MSLINSPIYYANQVKILKLIWRKWGKIDI
jgi:hypothetical protein